MKVSYSDAPVVMGEKSIFLAGPTVRKEQQQDWEKGSWRNEAIEILQELGFDGIVYVPEYSTMKDFVDKDDQFIWEWDALHAASLVVFWVPLKPILYGRPEGSDKNGYLDRIYFKALGNKPYNELKALLQAAVERLK